VPAHGHEETGDRHEHPRDHASLEQTATTANGQPAAAVYHRDAAGALRAHGVVVLSATATGVARVIEFHDPALVATFGFPEVLGP
jgi:RNA polymerase sigma-70 factor (ECF subfamily)